MPTTTNTVQKANVGAILGTALFGVVDDLVTAKEKNQQLPGILDKIAGIAKDAKDAGVDFLKAEAVEQTKKATPWIIAAVAVGLLVVLYFSRK